MSADHQDERFERGAAGVWRAAGESLERGAAERLAEARRRALRALETGAGARRRPAAWQPALGAAAAAVLTFAVLWIGRTPQVPDALERADRLPAASPADLELILAEENLELIENLDFYLWLGAEAGPIDESGATGFSG